MSVCVGVGGWEMQEIRGVIAEGGTYLAVAPIEVVVVAAAAVHCQRPMHLAMIHNTKDAAQPAS